jgi:putative ABC transport system ATP-binding protein
MNQNKTHTSFLQLKDLRKNYTEGTRTHDVLKKVNLRVETGELIILLGRSGSGKSTLLNLISGIDLPSSGEVVIGGENLTNYSEHDRTIFRRLHIGFIFQFFNLIPTLTVMENLLLPLELKNGNTSPQEDIVLDMLSEVGMKDRAKSFPDRLSGGEQQRIAIARALIHDPMLLLADEPTGNLDYDTGVQIINLLDRLVRKAGKTMIMATHSREVIGMADRIFSIKDGELIEIPAKTISSSKP